MALSSPLPARVSRLSEHLRSAAETSRADISSARPSHLTLGEAGVTGQSRPEALMGRGAAVVGVRWGACLCPCSLGGMRYCRLLCSGPHPPLQSLCWAETRGRAVWAPPQNCSTNLCGRPQEAPGSSGICVRSQLFHPLPGSDFFPAPFYWDTIPTSENCGQ